MFGIFLVNNLGQQHWKAGHDTRRKTIPNRSCNRVNWKNGILGIEQSTPMRLPMPETQRSDWLVLCDLAGPVYPQGVEDVVQSGCLVLELTLPKDRACVLLDYRSDLGWPRVFSIFQDVDVGIVVLNRQGATVLRHVLPGPLPRDWTLARLTCFWDGPARVWTLRLEDASGTWSLVASGANPMPLAGADLLALCAGPNAASKDAAVHWFGFCRVHCHHAPPAWIGHRTPIDTARGRVVAGDLRADDRVATQDNGYQPLQSVRHMMVPSRGRLAPMLLRALYFGRHTDLLVGQNQLILVSGSAVEYLFGEDAVLAPAAALHDGNSAFLDLRRPLVAGVTLDFGQSELVLADGCALLC